MQVNYVKSRSVFTLAIILVLLIAFGCDVTSKKLQEMPVTSSSKEALNNFNLGLDHFLLYENDEAAKAFETAISIDNEFALAYLFLALSNQGSDLYDQNLTKAYDLRNLASAGEAMFIESFQFDREGKGDILVKNIDSLMIMFPDDVLIPVLAANWFFYSEDDKCIALIEKTIEIDSTYFMGHVSLGQKYVTMEEV